MLIRVGLAAVISAKASGMSMALFPFAVGGGCALLHASREFLRSPYTALHGAAYTAAYKKINGSKAPKNAGTDSVGPQKKKLFDFKRLFSTESRMRKHMGDALIAELSGERPNIEICRQFIQAGADLRRHDKAGCTALIHTASIPELSVLARQLLVHGADINARNKIGKTARDVAKEQENNDDMINVFKPSNVKEAYAEGFRHVAEKGTPRKHKIHRRKPAAGAPT
ncbi:MAG: ankyrin repeat domain-containing protein [Alphaproteobacteria bacterium]|nr:ankyrin repeat domain-containing protein [Alphaproteobacteria bacterium]